jgi:LPXTG-site transpeptidase (sortase) family protein
MRRRRVLSGLLILAGLVLLSAVAVYYWQGWRAQETARRVWEATRAALPVPTIHVPTPTAPAVEVTENPGIAGGLPEQTPVPSEPPYPQGQPVGRIRIPAAKVDYVVFGGDDAATLKKGPGHVPGTELPGQDTYRKNCVITGHRDTHFRGLASVRKGHTIDLESPSGTVTYRVVSREIVMPDAIRVLKATEKPRLTLITCYPFNWVGAAPKRLVIVAEPVIEQNSHGKITQGAGG